MSNNIPISMQAHPGLSERARQLVELRWESVNQAAKALGVPQQSLNRLVSGGTANPRASLLTALAQGAGVTVDWLLTGVGEPPRIRDERGKRIDHHLERWADTVDALNLPGDAHSRVENLPYAVWEAAIAGSGLAPNSPKFYELAEEATTLSVRAWTALLNALVQLRGKERVRRWVLASESRIALGFSEGSSVLLAGDESLRGLVMSRLRSSQAEPNE